MKKLNIKVDIKAEELRKKLNVKDGVDGKDGKDGITPSTTEVASEASKLAVGELKPLIPNVPLEIEKNPSSVRNSLELLQDNDRLDYKAIRGIDDYDEVAKLAREPKVEKIYQGGGGAKSFIQLNDVPNSYTGQAGKYPVVKTDETGLEFGTLDLSGYVPYTGATTDVNIGTHSFIGHAIKGDASDGLLIESNNGTDIGLLGAGNTANVTWYGNHNFNPSVNTTSSYTNIGGSGDRRKLVTVTTTITSLNGTPDYLVNGNTTESFFYWAGQTASGKYLRFDFGTTLKPVITEAKWYQDLSTSQGVWRWQGSNDASSWTNIGNTFTLGGAVTQTQTELNGNTTPYRYYQLLGVSGSLSGSPYDREIEFKVAVALETTNVQAQNAGGTWGSLRFQNNGFPVEIGGNLNVAGGINIGGIPLVNSRWLNNGNDIYFPEANSTYNVGINRIATAGYGLDIEKTMRLITSTSNAAANFYFANSNSNGVRFVMDSPISPLFVASAFILSLTNANDGFLIFDNNTERYRFQRDGKAGFGTNSPSARLHLVSTTEQARFGYDASNYANITVGSTGGTTFNAVGSGAGFTFSNPVSATTLKATTSGGYISSDGSTGASGTFTTADAKTVTVKDGIITSIV